MKKLRRMLVRTGLLFAAMLVVWGGCSPDAPTSKTPPPQPSAPAVGTEAPFFPPALRRVDPATFDKTALDMENFLIEIAECIRARAVTDAAGHFAPDFQGVPILAAPTGTPSVKKLA